MTPTPDPAVAVHLIVCRVRPNGTAHAFVFDPQGILSDCRYLLAALRAAPEAARAVAAALAAAPTPAPDAERLFADALVNWYDTTHGNEFGHDHHCRAPFSDQPYTQPVFDGCTCGWSAVQLAEGARK